MMGKYEYEIGPGMHFMHYLRAKGENRWKNYFLLSFENNVLFSLI